MDNAKVQLGFTEIRSPIDGRTGNLTVKQGNVVMANHQELVTINQIEPIYVTFSVPEAQLPAIKRYMAEGTLQVRSRPQDDAQADEETGVADFRGQRRGHDHRHHQAEGDFPEHRPPAVAGAVRARHAAADHAAQCRGGAQPGGSDRPERVLCLRREAGPHGGIAGRGDRARAWTRTWSSIRVWSRARPW